MASGPISTIFREAAHALGFGATTTAPTPRSAEEQFIIDTLANPAISLEAITINLTRLSLHTKPEYTTHLIITHLTDTNLKIAQDILEGLRVKGANFKKIREAIQDAKSGLFSTVRFSSSAKKATRVNFLATAITIELDQYTREFDRNLRALLRDYRTTASISSAPAAAGGAGAALPRTMATTLTHALPPTSSEGEDPGPYTTTPRR